VVRDCKLITACWLGFSIGGLMLANAKWKLEFAMLLLLTGGRAVSFAVPLQAANKQANQIVKEGQSRYRGGSAP